MHSELDVLKDICSQLDSNEISYMLTGSFAANFYALPRMTRDIDIVIEIYPQNVEKVYRIFQKDFYIDKTSINEAIQHRNMFNIIHNDLSLKIDFIIRKDDEYRQIEFQRKKKIYLDNIPIWIVTLEDLIISKLYWAKDSHSEIQMKDVRNLLLSSPQIDFSYMKEWIDKLNLFTLYEKVKINE